jgi:hypothetical protein
VKWEVRSLSLLVERVIPHFHAYPIRSGKQHDFELFASVCEAMASGRHRDPVGLCEIVRWAGAVRAGVDSSVSFRDEGIVCPPSNRGNRRSSDLHEWRNDLATVSTRDPAKLHDE